MLDKYRNSHLYMIIELFNKFPKGAWFVKFCKFKIVVSNYWFNVKHLIV